MRRSGVRIPSAPPDPLVSGLHGSWEQEQAVTSQHKVGQLADRLRPSASAGSCGSGSPRLTPGWTNWRPGPGSATSTAGCVRSGRPGRPRPPRAPGCWNASASDLPPELRSVAAGRSGPALVPADWATVIARGIGTATTDRTPGHPWAPTSPRCRKTRTLGRYHVDWGASVNPGAVGSRQASMKV